MSWVHGAIKNVRICSFVHFSCKVMGKKGEGEGGRGGGKRETERERDGKREKLKGLGGKGRIYSEYTQ